MLCITLEDAEDTFPQGNAGQSILGSPSPSWCLQQRSYNSGRSPARAAPTFLLQLLHRGQVSMWVGEGTVKRGLVLLISARPPQAFWSADAIVSQLSDSVVKSCLCLSCVLSAVGFCHEGWRWLITPDHKEFMETWWMEVAEAGLSLQGIPFPGHTVSPYTVWPHILLCLPAFIHYLAMWVDHSYQYRTVKCCA